MAVILWKDIIRTQNGVWVYPDADDADAPWRRLPGATSRSRHLQHCIDQLDGRFRAIIARARNVHAEPREIESCFPQKDVWWKIVDFEPDGSRFTAQIDV